ncbi:hypothetical protein [Teichococcus aestuarii]|uniref:hypothetical protein n=1 Tax=Teichococcus aestuarii TaxID=568898 RepID=UPI0036072F9E
MLIRRWGVSAITATTVLALYPPLLYLPVWWLVLPSSLGTASPGAIGFQFFYQGFIAVVVAGFLFTRAVVALGGGLTTTITALTPRSPPWPPGRCWASRWAWPGWPASPWSRRAWRSACSSEGAEPWRRQCASPWPCRTRAWARSRRTPPPCWKPAPGLPARAPRCCSRRWPR